LLNYIQTFEMLPTWKIEILEKAIGDAIIENHVSAGCAEGDNVAGVVEKISLITKREQKFDMVCKRIPSTITAENEWIVNAKIFRREHGNFFY